MLSSELNQAMQIAREASAVLLQIYATDFTVDFKGSGRSDPVTEADRSANALIVSRLREAFPDDGIIAEESQHHDSVFTKRRIWYVDPLDGTKEFVAKNGEFSVMIGLAIDGRAQLGVVLQPSDGTIYAGVIGQGAFVERHDNQTHNQTRTPLQVSELKETDQLTLITSRSHRPKATNELMARLRIERELSSGSVGLKVGHIALRNADLYVHMSDKSSAWDTCAPEAILVAAGGRFTDLAGDAIVYGIADVRTRRGILASNAAAFDAVLPVVRELAAREKLITLA